MSTLLAATLLQAGGVRAEPNCRAVNVVEPISAEDLPIHHPGYQHLHAAMHAVEEMVRPTTLAGSPCLRYGCA